MCGIAGIINERESADRSVLERAAGFIAHRGPDAEGFYIKKHIGLLHRRLSIIDLAGGSQPMFNEDRSLVLVFNGEIYNFAELRAELALNGHVFATSSDSEVILHGFEQWGTDCIKKFHGMFAFALYNHTDESVFLSCDRCGEKPLYYAHKNGKFVFASEIRALTEILGHTPSPDPKAVYLYLLLGYIPAPRTFYQGIKKLPPGSCLLLKNDSLKEWKYYQPDITACSEISENDLCDELDAALRRAVRKMLVSDVPLGAFLSGGLDSSLIAAMMAREGTRPETFSISFSHTSFDEAQFAKTASESIGTNHNQYTVKFGNLQECLSIMDGFGEPFADSSAIPGYYLAKETKKKVTVALSGDGADELFGGYRRYLGQNIARYYLMLPNFFQKMIREKLLPLFSDRDVYYADSLVKSARIFADRTETVRPYSGLMLNTIFSHDEIAALFPDLPDSREIIKDCIDVFRSTVPVKALMYADRDLYLPGDILVKVDRMSMRNSLEVRAPYLDPDVLSLSDRIPLSMKIKGMNQKYILRKVALRYLPAETVFRKKHGFMAPVSQWLRQAGAEEIRTGISCHADDRTLDSLLLSHFNGKADQSHKIFSLLVLSRYLR